MSATLDVTKFSRFFDRCPVFSIPGRLFEVAVYHAEEDDESRQLKDHRAAYLARAIETVQHIHLHDDEGDVLVFLTGQAEIEKACDALDKFHHKLDYADVMSTKVEGMMVLPLYAALDQKLQRDVFFPAPPGIRKVVVCTNIAATSVTIDGIRYVVDPGYVKQKQYDSRTGMDALVVTPISQSAAEQRSGRAGRTEAGKCYRLYTARFFRDVMDSETKPEIQRTSLAGTVLTLKKLGIDDCMGFDFIDPPDSATLVKAIVQLFLLGALNRSGKITKIGETMSAFPVSPVLSRLLVSSRDHKCGHEAVTITAMLSVEEVYQRQDGRNPIYHAQDGRQLARDGRDQEVEERPHAAETFFHRLGDHLALLKIFKEFKKKPSAERYNWCREQGLRFRSVNTALEVDRQLRELMKAERLPLESAFDDFDPKRDRKTTRENYILRAVAESCWYHTARKHTHNSWYIPVVPAMRTLALQAHPTSVLCGREQTTDWVVFHEVVNTSKSYMQCMSVIDEDWVKPKLPLLSEVNVDKLCGREVGAKIKLMSGNLELPIDLRSEGEQQAAREEAAKRLKTSKYLEKSVDERTAEAESARERYLKRKRTAK